RWASLNEDQRRAWKETGRLRVRNEWVDTDIGYGLVEEADQYPLETLLAGGRTPLLIFHGLRDDSIPYQGSLQFAEGAAFDEIELRLFRNGDHRLTAWKDEIAESACRFFA